MAITSIGNHLFIRSIEFEEKEACICWYVCSGSLSLILLMRGVCFPNGGLSHVSSTQNEIISDGGLFYVPKFYFIILLCFVFVIILHNVVSNISEL